MHFTVKESGTLGVLTLQGDITRYDLDELKVFLHRALDYTARVIVDCEGVTDMDPTCLQLLCSAYRQSQKLRKSFAVAGHRRDVFLNAARAAAYVHCVGCGLETEQGCMWGMN